eukprot:CAMPEP_0175137556 /NCGR_PEP_ID=MMETSP0087-20121206/9876_1 /TAXON_ID=136419 /ORGANISM="Unknown Unknown, Strain D1" /LENGTH=270 /DNA_ID=CAMNT_0016420395 /DNA_START=97 /DNA_END=912 /DNA_ORIENTATION=-
MAVQPQYVDYNVTVNIFKDSDCKLSHSTWSGINGFCVQHSVDEIYVPQVIDGEIVLRSNCTTDCKDCNVASAAANISSCTAVGGDDPSERYFTATWEGGGQEVVGTTVYYDYFNEKMVCNSDSSPKQRIVQSGTCQLFESDGFGYTSMIIRIKNVTDNSAVMGLYCNETCSWCENYISYSAGECSSPLVDKPASVCATWAPDGSLSCPFSKSNTLLIASAAVYSAACLLWCMLVVARIYRRKRKDAFMASLPANEIGPVKAVEEYSILEE